MANASGQAALIRNGFKIALVAGLLYFLVQKGFISIEATSKAFGRLDLIAPSVAMMLTCSLLGVVRWQWLLQAQGIHLRWLRTLQLAFIGNFFNIALPGAVSGDFVKAFYVANEAPGKRARAFGSILFDRVAGLSALVLVAAGALMLDIEVLWGTPLFRAIRFFVLLAAIAVVVFYGYLFLVREAHDPFLRMLRRLEARFSKAGSIARIYESIRHYHSHRWTVLRVLGLSIVVHLLVGLTCAAFLRALDPTEIPLLPIFVVVPLGLLVTAVPVAPAGVGTGHAAFSYLFHFLGTQRGADVFSLYALMQLATGAIGGLVYLRFKTHAPRPPLEAIDSA